MKEGRGRRSLWFEGMEDERDVADKLGAGQEHDAVARSLRSHTSVQKGEEGSATAGPPSPKGRPLDPPAQGLGGRRCSACVAAPWRPDPTGNASREKWRRMVGEDNDEVGPINVNNKCYRKVVGWVTYMYYLYPMWTYYRYSALYNHRGWFKDTNTNSAIHM